MIISKEVTYEPVPNAFKSNKNGNVIQSCMDAEEEAIANLYDKIQQQLQDWNMFPGSQDNRKTFFELVHCMLLNPSIVKLTKNPYDLDWDEAHRLEKKLSLTSPVLKIFYSLHFQLTKVIHNSIPHYLQMLALTPSRISLWKEMATKAAKLGDWKNVEFAYRKFIEFGGNKAVGLQCIVLSYFVSGDFLMALESASELLNYQLNNTVGVVVVNEIKKLNGPWKAFIDKLSICNTRHLNDLTPDKTAMVMNKIREFRKTPELKCVSCIDEFKYLGQSLHRFELEQKDALFYNFGKRLLTFCEKLEEESNAFIFFTFPFTFDDFGELHEDINYEFNSFDELVGNPYMLNEDQVGSDQAAAEEVSPKLPNFIKCTAGISFLQVSDFIQELTGVGQWEKKKKYIYGFYGMARVFDDLIINIIERCKFEELKGRKRDLLVFKDVYQCWHKLVKGSGYKSRQLEDIHFYASKLGSKRALCRLERSVCRILQSVRKDDDSNISQRPLPTTPSFDPNVDINEFRSNSPTFEGLARTYQQLKTLHADNLSSQPMEVDQEVEEAKAESDPIELFHLLALYFAHTAPAKNVPRKPKFELLPPDYLLNVGYASELNIFSSKDFDLMRLSKKDCCFLVAYHLSKADSYCPLGKHNQVIDSVEKAFAHKHLFAFLEVVNAHLLKRKDELQNVLKSRSAFERSEVVAEILGELKVTTKQIESTVKRMAKLGTSLREQEKKIETEIAEELLKSKPLDQNDC